MLKKSFCVMLLLGFASGSVDLRALAPTSQIARSSPSNLKNILSEAGGKKSMTPAMAPDSLRHIHKISLLMAIASLYLLFHSIDAPEELNPLGLVLSGSCALLGLALAWLCQKALVSHYEEAGKDLFSSEKKSGFSRGFLQETLYSHKGGRLSLAWNVQSLADTAQAFAFVFGFLFIEKITHFDTSFSLWLFGGLWVGSLCVFFLVRDNLSRKDLMALSWYNFFSEKDLDFKQSLRSEDHPYHPTRRKQIAQQEWMRTVLQSLIVPILVFGLVWCAENSFSVYSLIVFLTVSLLVPLGISRTLRGKSEVIPISLGLFGFCALGVFFSLLFSGSPSLTMLFLLGLLADCVLLYALVHFSDQDALPEIEALSASDESERIKELSTPIRENLMYLSKSLETTRFLASALSLASFVVASASVILFTQWHNLNLCLSGLALYVLGGLAVWRLNRQISQKSSDKKSSELHAQLSLSFALEKDGERKLKKSSGLLLSFEQVAVSSLLGAFLCLGQLESSLALGLFLPGLAFVLVAIWKLRLVLKTAKNGWSPKKIKFREPSHPLQRLEKDEPFADLLGEKDVSFELERLEGAIERLMSFQPKNGGEQTLSMGLLRSNGTRDFFQIFLYGEDQTQEPMRIDISELLNKKEHKFSPDWKRFQASLAVISEMFNECTTLVSQAKDDDTIQKRFKKIREGLFLKCYAHLVKISYPESKFNRAFVFSLPKDDFSVQWNSLISEHISQTFSYKKFTKKKEIQNLTSFRKLSPPKTGEFKRFLEPTKGKAELPLFPVFQYQSTPQAGAFEKNVQDLMDVIDCVAEMNASIDNEDKKILMIHTGEMSLCGYNLGEIVERKDFFKEQRDAEARLREKADDKGIGILYGLAQESKTQKGILFISMKTYIPSSHEVLEPKNEVRHKSLLYGKGEGRETLHFSECIDWKKNLKPLIFEWKHNQKKVRVGLLICEDSWNGEISDDRPHADTGLETNDPVRVMVSQDVDILVNSSASPATFRKMYNITRPRFQKQALFYGLPYIFTTIAGVQKGLCFNGGSFSFNQQGECQSSLPLFRRAGRILDFATGELVMFQTKELHKGRGFFDITANTQTLSNISVSPKLEKNREIHEFCFAFLLGLLDNNHGLAQATPSPYEFTSQKSLVYEHTGDSNSLYMAWLLSSFRSHKEEKFLNQQAKIIVHLNFNQHLGLSNKQKTKQRAFLEKHFSVRHYALSQDEKRVGTQNRISVSIRDASEYQTGQDKDGKRRYRLFQSLTKSQLLEFTDQIKIEGKAFFECHSEGRFFSVNSQRNHVTQKELDRAIDDLFIQAALLNRRDICSILALASQEIMKLLFAYQQVKNNGFKERMIDRELEAIFNVQRLFPILDGILKAHCVDPQTVCQIMPFSPSQRSQLDSEDQRTDLYEEIEKVCYSLTHTVRKPPHPLATASLSQVFLPFPIPKISRVDQERRSA